MLLPHIVWDVFIRCFYAVTRHGPEHLRGRGFISFISVPVAVTAAT